MPRNARIVLPGYLYHITQRGNNRQQIFFEDNDYVLYLKRIEQYRRKFAIDLFAYCLMPNHVHFIVRPRHKDALAGMFRGVNMRYAKYFQRKTSASGHVWQGRFYSCVLHGTHVKEAIRYVELNPVRAKMVSCAWAYPWASTRAHMGKVYQLVTLADINQVIQADDWRAYLTNGSDPSFDHTLRAATKKNLIVGPQEFLVKLEKTLGRTLTARHKRRTSKNRKKGSVPINPR